MRSSQVANAMPTPSKQPPLPAGYMQQRELQLRKSFRIKVATERLVASVINMSRWAPMVLSASFALPTSRLLEVASLVLALISCGCSSLLLLNGLLALLSGEYLFRLSAVCMRPAAFSRCSCCLVDVMMCGVVVHAGELPHAQPTC